MGFSLPYLNVGGGSAHPQLPVTVPKGGLGDLKLLTCPSYSIYGSLLSHPSRLCLLSFCFPYICGLVIFLIVYDESVGHASRPYSAVVCFFAFSWLPRVISALLALSGSVSLSCRSRSRQCPRRTKRSETSSAILLTGPPRWM